MCSSQYSLGLYVMFGADYDNNNIILCHSSYVILLWRLECEHG